MMTRKNFIQAGLVAGGVLAIAAPCVAADEPTDEIRLIETHQLPHGEYRYDLTRNGKLIVSDLSYTQIFLWLEDNMTPQDRYKEYDAMVPMTQAHVRATNNYKDDEINAGALEYISAQKQPAEFCSVLAARRIRREKMLQRLFEATNS